MRTRCEVALEIAIDGAGELLALQAGAADVQPRLERGVERTGDCHVDAAVVGYVDAERQRRGVALALEADQVSDLGRGVVLAQIAAEVLAEGLPALRSLGEELQVNGHNRRRRVLDSELNLTRSAFALVGGRKNRVPRTAQVHSAVAGADGRSTVVGDDRCLVGGAAAGEEPAETQGECEVDGDAEQKGTDTNGHDRVSGCRERNCWRTADSVLSIEKSQ